MEAQPRVVHVVCFPFIGLGHVKPMLKLAELLSKSKSRIEISFVTIQSNYDRFLVSTNIEEFQQSHPNIHFLTFADSLPPQLSQTIQGRLDSISSFKAKTKPALRELLLSLRLPPTCIVSDTIMCSAASEVSKEFQIPLLCFQTTSAWGTWIDFHLSKLLETGAIPMQDEDLDKPITQIPDLGNVIRFRDLPSCCRIAKIDKRAIEFSIDEFNAASQASALIINTFDEFEAPMISKLSSYYSKIFSIGPLHCLLDTQIENSFVWKSDSDCLTWLDTQPSRSVVYVSFGSVTCLKAHELLEIWHGLVNSGKSFLLVIRPNSIIEEDGLNSRPSEILMEIEEKSKGKGLIVSWAPQEKVLAHSAIGGFLTHGGWNSILESIFAGIPMICRPFQSDQLLNSRCISEIWRIGFDMKDTCDRSIVEKMVRDLFGDKREEIMESMNKISKQARQSVMKGGSSYCNLEKLTNHIISMVP